MIVAVNWIGIAEVLYKLELALYGVAIVAFGFAWWMIRIERARQIAHARSIIEQGIDASFKCPCGLSFVDCMYLPCPVCTCLSKPHVHCMACGR